MSSFASLTAVCDAVTIAYPTSRQKPSVPRLPPRPRARLPLRSPAALGQRKTLRPNSFLLALTLLKLSVTLRQNGNTWSGGGVLSNGGNSISFALAGYEFAGSWRGGYYQGYIYDGFGQAVDVWYIF